VKGCERERGLARLCMGAREKRREREGGGVRERKERGDTLVGRG
jgi:hypothetical protein